MSLQEAIQKALTTNPQISQAVENREAVEFELRQARGLSQKMLADVLHVQQPSIAKIEKRTDMYISTLRSHIEAMGGQLEVVARFPDGAVKISNFSDLGSSAVA